MDAAVKESKVGVNEVLFVHSNRQLHDNVVWEEQMNNTDVSQCTKLGGNYKTILPLSRMYQIWVIQDMLLLLRYWISMQGYHKSHMKEQQGFCTAQT